MSLPFEPICSPMLLGSLPYRNAAQALEVSRRYAGTLLAWPQLWPRGFREQGVVQSAIGFPGLVVDEDGERVYVDRTAAMQAMDRLELAYLENNLHEAMLSDADAPGLAEVARQGESLRAARALKGQLFGPISLAAQITDEQQRPLIYDEALFDALTHHLRLRVTWQETYLAEVSSATIICLDEPFLEMVGLPFLPIDWEEARARIEEVFGGVVGCKAIFAGGAVDWGQVLRTSVDMIVADVYQHGASLLGAAESLGEFVDRNGVVGLGIVPADADALEQSSAEGLARRVQALLDDLERAGIAPGALLRRAVITPSGALGPLDAPSAERALQLLGAVSKLLREQYGL